MSTLLITLRALGLLACFALLVWDFLGFVLTDGQQGYLALAALLPPSLLDAVTQAATLEGTTWSNVNRLALLPLLTLTPLWAVCLVLALIAHVLTPPKP